MTNLEFAAAVEGATIRGEIERDECRSCDRCLIPEHFTDEGILAYHGTRLVCADCDVALNNEEHDSATHPLNALHYTRDPR